MIPAAFSVAAATNATQMQLLHAVAVGDEAMGLVGYTAGGMETVHREFHPTSVSVLLGAAAACISLYAYQSDREITAQELVLGWALAQACGPMRFSAGSDGGARAGVPTSRDLGLESLDFYTVNGHFASKVLPAPIAQAFNAVLRKALADPVVQDRFHELSLAPPSPTLAESAAEIGEQRVFWKIAFAPAR